MDPLLMGVLFWAGDLVFALQVDFDFALLNDLWEAEDHLRRPAHRLYHQKVQE